MHEPGEDRSNEVHPIPWVGEGTVPDVPRAEERRRGGLVRFAAGTAAVALAVGVGGGMAIRSLEQHGPNAGASSPPAGQRTAPAPAPAPAAPGDEHGEHGESD